MKCAQWNIDFISELDRVIMDTVKLVYVSGTLEELDRLAQGDSKLAQNAKVAKMFLKAAEELEVSVGGIVDDRILIAVQNDKSLIVATHDADVKRKAQQIGADLVIIRQKKYLVYMAS